MAPGSASPALLRPAASGARATIRRWNIVRRTPVFAAMIRRCRGSFGPVTRDCGGKECQHCRPKCTNNTDSDDTSVCNGDETCDANGHVVPSIPTCGVGRVVFREKVQLVGAAQGVQYR